MQPTAIINLISPITFWGNYENLFVTSPRYLYYLDNLLLQIGVVPLILIISAIFSFKVPKKIKIGFLGFIFVMIIVALQQTKIYYILFELPFYNLFRGYFLFSILIFFAAIVFSGYGFDALISTPFEKRNQFVKKIIRLFSLVALTIFSYFAVLLSALPFEKLFNSLNFLLVLVDISSILLAVTIFWKTCNVKDVNTVSRNLIISLVLTQIPIMIYSWERLSIKAIDLRDKYGLNSASFNNDELDTLSSSEHKRIRCEIFAQCYLVNSGAVSLNLDLEGTFLRNKNEPVFQRALNENLKIELSGLTGSDIWLSNQIFQYSDQNYLIRYLNEIKLPVGEMFLQTSYINSLDLPMEFDNKIYSEGIGSIKAINKGVDRISVAYSSSAPMLLAFKINFHPGWHATVNGVKAPVIKANLGGIVVPVPTGSGTVSLIFNHLPTDLYFISRYIVLALGIFAAIYITKFKI